MYIYIPRGTCAKSTIKPLKERKDRQASLEGIWACKGQCIGKGSQQGSFRSARFGLWIKLWEGRIVGHDRISVVHRKI